jgi:hypothetical protein
MAANRLGILCATTHRTIASRLSHTHAIAAKSPSPSTIPSAIEMTKSILPVALSFAAPALRLTRQNAFN